MNPQPAARGCAASRIRAAALLWVFLFLSELALASEASAEKRIALVIGNSAYGAAPLANPINDANAIASKLRELGFEVIVKSNAGQREMTRALSEFGERITPGSVALFYYAGHGIQARGKNFLIPVDADIRNENAISSEAVDVERVLDQLGAARLSMVVLDACRNNPFERRFRSGTGRGLAQIDAPAGSLIAYATAPGKVALDGDRGHGPYTEALLRAIDTPGLRVEDVFKQVRIQVLKVTGNQQIPWEASSLTGDFLFRPAPVVVDAARVQAEKDAAAVRGQLQALSAEMEKMREMQAKAALSKSEPEQRRLDQDTIGIRDQLAALNAEIAKLRQAQSVPASAPAAASEQRKAEHEAAELRKQLALLNAELGKRQEAPGAPPVASQYEDAWKKRLATLHSARGKLTLASAMQQLLDITSPDDSAALQTFESGINRRPYNNAFAIGVDAGGQIVWGGGHNWETVLNATETALEICGRAGANNCRVIITNSRFDETAWLAAMMLLGTLPADDVRHVFMDTLRRPLLELSFAARRGSGGAAPESGYTFTPARR